MGTAVVAEITTEDLTMPRYRPADLPNILHIPLDVLARGDRRMSDADAAERVRTALHEGAHLAAACYCVAYVYHVYLSPSGRPNSRGEFGKVCIAERLPEDGAFCSLVGYAWEELHGDTACAANDLRDGNRLADEAERSREDLLNEAREFVRTADELIRVAALILLATVPKSGILKNRTLRGVLDWFYPLQPETARDPQAARSFLRRYRRIHAVREQP